MTTIGFIGLGTMGKPMAANLLKKKDLKSSSTTAVLTKRKTLRRWAPKSPQAPPERPEGPTSSSRC